jgi:hypothetical protein
VNIMLMTVPSVDNAIIALRTWVLHEKRRLGTRWRLPTRSAAGPKIFLKNRALQKSLVSVNMCLQDI